MTVFIPSFSALAARYDAFILDLWGVIHDGQQLYPGVKETLQKLRGQGKGIVFLSNAPRRASVVQEALERMEIEETLYDAIVTSGETAYQWLAGSPNVLGKSYFYIGLEKDRRLLQGLDYREAREPEASDFLLLAHSYADNQPIGDLTPLLERCLSRKLPALCINPDLEVVRMSGEHVYCAGRVAQEYEAMGGKVMYFGKPHEAVYEACFSLFAGMAKERMLAVGDNLATDIQGARRAGIDNALVTGGVLKKALRGEADYEAACNAIFERGELAPDYVLRAFSW